MDFKSVSTKVYNKQNNFVVVISGQWPMKMDKLFVGNRQVSNYISCL